MADRDTDSSDGLQRAEQAQAQSKALREQVARGRVAHAAGRELVEDRLNLVCRHAPPAHAARHDPGEELGGMTMTSPNALSPNARTLRGAS